MLGEDAGLVGELVAFQFALLTQDADHPPLLLGQVMGVEGRAEERHGCFAGLQEGQGQEGLGKVMLISSGCKARNLRGCDLGDKACAQHFIKILTK